MSFYKAKTEKGKIQKKAIRKVKTVFQEANLDFLAFLKTVNFRFKNTLSFF